MYQITQNIHCTHLIEITFRSHVSYVAPFYDITLDVRFTAPSGKTHCVPAYWSGEQNWVVRYTSNEAGTHAFQTICSDRNNQSLHQITSEFAYAPYRGDNALFNHGAPRVASDKRHFCHADGKPFLWLGDTWWMGLCKRLSWPEFQVLSADRQQKGFSVVQLVAGLYPDMPAFDPRGASVQGFAWQAEFNTINPAWWDEADQRIMHLVNLAIVPCVLGAWGYYLPWLGVEKMKLHWRYIMARWGALPMVWAAAGEQTMAWYLSTDKETESARLKQEWSDVIRYMHSINCYARMITTHPVRTARDSVDDQSLLDFDMQQTGHRSNTLRQAAKARMGWDTQPVMPVISGESRYEALAISPAVTTHHTREAFWAHLLNSGCAGHTYGANGIWQVNQPDAPFGQSPNGHNWGNISWDLSMQLPGSTQLAHAKNLLLALPWQALQAQPINRKSWPKFIQRVQSKFQRYQTPVAGAQTPDQSCVLSYYLSQKPCKIDLSRFKSPIVTYWVDPTNGAFYTNSPVPLHQQKILRCTPPHKNAAGENDWLLLVTSSPRPTASD